MTKKDKEIINTLLANYFLILLEVKKGKTYLLWQHYRYLNPYKEAKRVLIARKELFDKGIIYISNKI